LKFALCATALAFGVVLAPLATASTTKQSVSTFHLVEIDHSFSYVDNPPKGGSNQPPSAGDSFEFSSELRTPSGKHAGWLYASCSAVTGGQSGQSLCLGTFRLAGGELIASATAGNENGPTDIAILGGTKAYAGMRGTVHSVPVGGENSTRSNDTFRIWK